MSYALFDVVVLIDDVPDEGLKAGMIGAIVDIYSQPIEAYEVEFCDSEGRTIAQLALLPQQIRPI